MSFILDALKKSEAERQRQSGPTLLELRVSPQRRRYPLWAVWVGVLLALNAAILLFVLLRRPTAPLEPVAALRPATPPAALAPLPGAAPTPPAQPAQAPLTAPAAQVTAVAPLAGAAAPNETAAAANAATSPNPADDEPALPAGARTSTPQAPLTTTTIATTNYELLPNLSTLGGNLPALQLNLLDYSDLASERYALVNMHRVHEGDVLPEGPRVLAITRDGVAMDYNGQQFMLRSSNAGASP